MLSPKRYSRMGDRCLIGAVALVGLLVSFTCIAIADPRSEPAATPPPVIIDVRASELCKTIHDAAQPAMVGLMTNDNLLHTADRALDRNDLSYLRSVVGPLTYNLGTVEKFLGHRVNDLIVARLETITSAQKDAVDVIKGVVAAEAARGTPTLFGGVGQLGAGDIQPGPDYDQKAMRMPPPRTVSDPTIPNATVADRMQLRSDAERLEAAQTRISDLEDAASTAILKANQACH